MWVVFAITGYILLAVVFILDKKILTNDKQPPIVYTFFSSVFLLLASVAWFFIPIETKPLFWAVASLSGCTFVGGLYFMFTAVSKSEASHIDPFIGAVVTVATFFSARIFLGEVLSWRQTLGIFLLIVSSVFLSLEKTRKKEAHWRWYGLGILAGIFFALSNVSAKYLYDTFSFVSGLVGTRFMIGIFGLTLLFFPAVWDTISRANKRGKKPEARREPVGLVVLDKTLGIVAILLLQWATALGSVTVVNALAGLQYALMFVIILVLSRIHSGFLREYMTKSEIFIQTCALLLVIVGLVLMV